MNALCELNCVFVCMQLVEHIGIMHKLPEIANESLSADSKEEEMYLQMIRRGRHSG